MTFEILIQIVLFAVALAMDAFAVSVADGLIYEDINKKKSIFIASIFGLFQGLLPLIGYFALELITYVVGEAGGAEAAKILSIVVVWVAFALLLFIGGKMLIEGIFDLKKEEEIKQKKLFSYKEVLLMGIATAIDALAVGITLHTGYSTNSTIWLHVSIIVVITFIICLLGVFLGKQIVKLFKGKYEVTAIIGGAILILLAVWVVLSHYLGI